MPSSIPYQTWLKRFDDLIKKFPARDDPLQNESNNSRKRRSKERLLFRKLIAKLAGCSVHNQVAFLISQAQKLSSKVEVVEASLRSLPNPPDFMTLSKTNRRTYSMIHSLVDKVLPLAAGSTSPRSQLKLLEARFMFVHKQLLLPYTVNFKTLITLIDQLPWNVKEEGTPLSQETRLLQRLLNKIIGINNKQNQLKFLIHRAKAINKYSYVQEALKTLTTPPKYSMITKIKRRR